MNNDLLECKARAKDLVASDTPPCNENGRRKGYIVVMKELWDEKGYAHLKIKSQNLRDQASRLEKIDHTVGSTLPQERNRKRIRYAIAYKIRAEVSTRGL